MRAFYSVTTATLAIAMAAPLSAQTFPGPVSDDEIANDPDQIVVVGSRSPVSISELPASVYVIDQELIAQQTQGGVAFREMLAQLVPSLDISTQGRTNFGQNLRGRDVQVLINGVSLNGSRDISRQFDAIDPFNIERIEVLSGASSVYGGGATGGIINIITKKGAPGLGVSAEAGVRSGFEAGSDRDIRAAASISGGSETLYGRIGVAYQDNGAAYDGNGNRIFPDITQTDLQGNRSYDVTGNLTWAPSSNHNLQIMGQYYDSGYAGDDALYLGPNLAGAIGGRPDLLEVRSGFHSDVVPQTERRMITLDYAGKNLIAGQDLLIQAFYRKENLDFYPFPSRASVSLGGATRTLNFYAASSQNTEVYGIKTALVGDWGPVKLTYGVDAAHEKFDASTAIFDTALAFASGGMDLTTVDRIGRYPGFETKNYAGYAQADLRISNRFNLTGGIRYQHVDVSVEDFVAYQQQALISAGYASSADIIPGGKNDYDAFLLNAGAVYAIPTFGELYANYTEAFELPDPAKYYGVGRYALTGLGGTFDLVQGISVGTSPLDAIKTRQLETGLRMRRGPFSLQAAAFYAWSDKSIVTVPATLTLDVVDDKQRTYGIEGKVDVALPSGFVAGFSGIWVKTEQKTNDHYEPRTVSDASAPKLVTFVGFNRDQLVLRFQSTNSFDVSDNSGDRLKGYSVFDLIGSYQFGPVTMTGSLQNLFDASYQTIWSQRAQILYRGLTSPEVFDFGGRGRTFSLTASVEF